MKANAVEITIDCQTYYELLAALDEIRDTIVSMQPTLRDSGLDWRSKDADFSYRVQTRALPTRRNQK